MYTYCIYAYIHTPKTQMGSHILGRFQPKNGARQPPQKTVNWVLGIYGVYLAGHLLSVSGESHPKK